MTGCTSTSSSSGQAPAAAQARMSAHAARI